jgi:hypothetical protein
MLLFKEAVIQQVSTIKQIYTYLVGMTKIIISSKTYGHLTSPTHNGPKLNRLLQLTTTVIKIKNKIINSKKSLYMCHLPGVDKLKSFMGIKLTYLEVFKRSRRS